MKIIHAASELANGNRKVCLAIGVFDGVHLGHQQIIRQTVADARQHDALALVVTFDRHPNVIVAPDRAPPQIYSRPQKLRAIKSLGADALLEIHFDQAFSQKSGEHFIRELVRDLKHIHSICVGANFVFGHKRSGNVTLLKQLGAGLNFQVHGHAAVSLDGELVSSTRIRDAIRSGELDTASQMLGRPYAICGRVLEGDKIGTRLGFPTANLDVAGLALPPNGVYAASTKLHGQFYRVALNIGLRPTVAANRPQLRVEAHLLDFSGDLYGTELQVEIGAKLRDEQRFGSPDELRRQIERDVAAVRLAA
ncbi:MAG TPA: bifunctional riboflavin kinase/FAD synthetase [Candidatus Binatia bacterium]|nr:bifunctional riboflavin kinase/FAD synthetase [Candidatus Binatia bacterium]